MPQGVHPYDNRIKKLHIFLPPVQETIGSYQPVVITPGYAFISGQLSKAEDGKIITGKVGSDISLEEGRVAARLAAIHLLSIIRNAVGYDQFERIVKINGYVQSAPDFYDLPRVINGASDLLRDVFDDNGLHARSAVGMVSLPLNAAVELDAIIKLKTS